MDGADAVYEVVRVDLGGQMILVGSLSTPQGETMAFLVPSSGEAVLTSTWITSSRFPGGPLVGWSDGRCLTVESRRQRTPSLLSDNAPWLGWALRQVDGELLIAARGVAVAAWAVREMAGMAEILAVATASHGQPLGIEWEPAERGGAPPAFLEEHLDRIVGRFGDTRAHLHRLSEVGAPAAGP